MTQAQPPSSVHLVGSIGLDSVEEVFATVGPRLGRWLRRVPDGEVGGRRLWISWQYRVPSMIDSLEVQVLYPA